MEKLTGVFHRNFHGKASKMTFEALGTVNYGASGYASGDASGDASLL